MTFGRGGEIPPCSAPVQLGACTISMPRLASFQVAVSGLCISQMPNGKFHIEIVSFAGSSEKICAKNGFLLNSNKFDPQKLDVFKREFGVASSSRSDLRLGKKLKGRRNAIRISIVVWHWKNLIV